MHQGTTPLTFIQTETDRLQRWWPNLLDDTPGASEDREEVPQILKGMRVSAGTLRSLFNALRPLAGARRGPPESFIINSVIENITYLFKSKADLIGLAFTVSPEITGVKVKGYPSDLATALTNLIDNSIYWLGHHQISHANITFTIDVSALDWVTLFVEDNGRGIPEKVQDQLFDVGFTLKPNGTGLGLSIAREAIYRSGGQLEIAESDGGAKFKITLQRDT